MIGYLRGRYGRDWRALEPGGLAGPAGEAGRRLMARFLCYVEVELFSYCNRRCAFCPNAVIDRHSRNIMLPEERYLDLLRQLAALGFAGRLSFSRYNEPLADRVILARLAQARAALPGAFLHTNTNGDYLDPDYLAALREAGLDSLSVQEYGQGGQRLDPAGAAEAIARRAAALGYGGRGRFRLSPGEVAWTARDGGFFLEIRARNFAVLGNSRGGTVGGTAAAPRRAPCFEAHNGVYIDYTGAVLPCCNLRSDVPAHAAFVLGNIADAPLADLFLGPAAAALRRRLAGGDLPALCAACNFRGYLVAPSRLVGPGRVQSYYSIPTVAGYCRDRVAEAFSLRRLRTSATPANNA